MSIRDAQLAVARHYDVRLKHIKGRRREPWAACPRQVAMFIACEMAPGHGRQSAVGRAFGFDHTTVLHAIRQVRSRIATDEAECVKVVAAMIDAGIEARR